MNPAPAMFVPLGAARPSEASCREPTLARSQAILRRGTPRSMWFARRSVSPMTRTQREPASVGLEPASSVAHRATSTEKITAALSPSRRRAADGAARGGLAGGDPIAVFSPVSDPACVSFTDSTFLGVDPPEAIKSSHDPARRARRRPRRCRTSARTACLTRACCRGRPSAGSLDGSRPSS